ncbi:Peptidase M22, O-sialoglycoprotein peptidase [Nannochloropsis gaditana]|uniref:N(6)-L-threonylcarbamoyladenine synthase n=1 Tax=Nannochloropsis gaditana TaxID=72520 RepID=W7TQK2_9STRA|nr:Peptidase M22, O-sialoglycoprotein peptidase [Nannochloropsis gaditana]
MLILTVRWKKALKAVYVIMLSRISAFQLARPGLGWMEASTKRISWSLTRKAFFPTTPTAAKAGMDPATHSAVNPDGQTSTGTSQAPASATSSTRRRRRPAGSGASKASRDFVGMAKGTDTGQYPSFSADNFVQAASGLPTTSPEDPVFTVLGIETSCDDTGVAVVRSDGVILGEALASQYKIHEQWGGVVPGLARDAHASVIDSMVEEALKKAGMASVAEVGAVGVTVGPGLEICLRVGTETAKALATTFHKPFVAVHHLEAHCLMARFGQPLDSREPKEEAAGTSASSPIPPQTRFPFLALLVSGGHCMLLECWGVGRYRTLGGTLDDALGEAYDKAARLLKIGTGAAGGPAMERLAREGNPKAVVLPVPMRGKKNLNFSYAGLKNAFRMAVTRLKEALNLGEEEDFDPKTKADLAASFQHVAIQHLEERLTLAMKESERRGVHTLAVVGGVASNQAIRARLQVLCEKRSLARRLEKEQERIWDEANSENKGGGTMEVEAPLPPWELVVPPPRLCTDNGVMVAWAAIEKLRLGYSDVVEGRDVHARWPFASWQNST